jgi:hypothetical protein
MELKKNINFAIFSYNITCLSDIKCNGFTVCISVNNLSSQYNFDINLISRKIAFPIWIILNFGQYYSLLSVVNTVPFTLSSSAPIGDTVLRSETGNKLNFLACLRSLSLSFALSMHHSLSRARAFFLTLSLSMLDS